MTADVVVDNADSVSSTGVATVVDPSFEGDDPSWVETDESSGSEVCGIVVAVSGTVSSVPTILGSSSAGSVVGETRSEEVAASLSDVAVENDVEDEVAVDDDVAVDAFPALGVSSSDVTFQSPTPPSIRTTSRIAAHRQRRRGCSSSHSS